MHASHHTQLRLGLIALLLAAMSGCQHQPTTRHAPSRAASPEKERVVAREPTVEPLSAQGQISQILEMRRSGQITETEAARLLSALGASLPGPAEDAAVVVQAKPVSAYPTYHPRPLNQRLLRSVGSDSMDVLLQLWEESFLRYHQGLRVQHEGRGTSTAIPALLEGRSDIGPMSRLLKAEEVDVFLERFGYEPTQMPVAIDALAVYVHPDNPLARSGLTLQQLDAIFSSTRRTGAAEDVLTWGQLGLRGEWAPQPIKVYSRNTASGTYGFFKDVALRGGSFKSTNFELEGSAAVVDAVSQDRYAIGYSGIAYMTPGVRAVPLAAAEGKPFVPPSEVSAVSGEYPLARFLYLTVNRHPDDGMTPVVVEFLRFVYSEDGQAIVRKDGYYSISPSQVHQILESVEAQTR